MTLDKRMTIAEGVTVAGWVAFGFFVGWLASLLPVFWQTATVVGVYLVVAVRWVMPWTFDKVKNLVILGWIRQQPPEQQYLLLLYYKFGRDK